MKFKIQSLKLFFFYTVLIASVFLGSHSAWAHKVKIFAAVEHDIISGYGYFTSSARAKNVDVVFVGPDGKVFERIKTDDKGEFKVKARYRADTLISLSTVDGHGAQWLISADEFPQDLPEYLQESTAQSDLIKTSPSSENSSEESPDPQQVFQQAPEFASIIRREIRPLQEQINQLRAQMDMQEEKKNFQDILGGIGYIMGFTGILFYFAAKRRREHD